MGGSSYFDHNIAKKVIGDIGYCFFEELTVFGGIDMFSQSSSFLPFEAENDDARWAEYKTEHLTSLLLQAGIHH